MNTEKETKLMNSASRCNMWVLRYPDIKDYLIKELSELRKRYFTDGSTSADYPAFFADILKAHNDLYADSIPCRALFKDDDLKTHQEAVKHYRTIDRYLALDGDVHFKIHGWGNDDIHGVNILSVRVRNEKRKRWEEWDTTGLTWLPDRIGFDKMQNIVTDISNDDTRYNEIRDALRQELAKGWIGESGNATSMAPIRAFAVQCRGLNETIKKYLPESTKKQRANIIIGLFKLAADPSDFAEILDPPRKDA
ncbi:MAG: hypothetical protein IK145_07310 [Bacteroidales bacterium]|nr:hypothetical protein [Bacteroidales bacterium]